MPEERLAAGLLLVLGPVLALVPVGYPPLLGVWTASRETHLTTVAAHRRAWAMLNAGFGAATILTTAGLVLLGATEAASMARVGVAAATVAYAMGGVLWLAVLAIRTRTTPLLAGDLGIGRLEAPEAVLGAATGGLFAAFTVVTAVSLVCLGVVVASGGTTGGVAAGAIAALIAAVAIASQLRTGDSIPAVLYMPTILIGLAVLAGWA